MTPLPKRGEFDDEGPHEGIQRETQASPEAVDWIGPLLAMLAVQTANILSQRTFPGYGHREEKRVEPLIVEALSNIAPRSKDKPFLVIGYL